MRLEKRVVDVRKIVFDNESYIKDGIMHLSKEELINVAMDYNFKSVDFELAHPGESCRLNFVSDCIQPMCKLDSEDSTFPGVVDEVSRVGEGISVVVGGVSVTEVLMKPMVILSVIDMEGPATKESLTLPKLIHLCLIAEPTEDTSDNEYFQAVNVASKKIAKYVAECAKEVPPDDVEIYEISEENYENLPRVAYIFQIFSHAPLTDTVYYGDGCASMLPTIVHPNEVLDGAMIFRDYYQACNASPTYVYQNHPVIKELMSRHGKDINFVGLIISNTPTEVINKRRNAMMCAGLAKYHLKADCAIITKEGGGHPQIDVGLNCDACEELGIKTVLLITEFLSAGNPINELVLFATENADAMVTNGCISFLEFPRVNRVIGLEYLQDLARTGQLDAYGPFSYGAYTLVRDSINQIGNTQFTTVVY